MMATIFIGVKLPDKDKNSVKFQKILAKYNYYIKMRIGMNDNTFSYTSAGIIIIQINNPERAIYLEKELLEISGIELQRMVF